MKTIFKRAILCSAYLLSTSSAFAKVDALPFFESVQKRLLINTSHLSDITPHIFFAKPSLLQRWGVINRDAEALYNAFINTIILNDDLYKKDSRGQRLTTYEDFPASQYYSFTPRVSTVFHELSHADFDVFVEEDKTSDIYRAVMKDLYQWVRQNRSGTSPKDVAQETFGYLAGNIIMVLSTEIQNTMIAHGINLAQSRCFNERYLKKWASKNHYDRDGIRYVSLFNNKSYRNRFFPDYIFIRGKDVDIRQVPQGIKDSIINYFVRTYEVPTNPEELAAALEKSRYYQGALLSCYKNL